MFSQVSGEPVDKLVLREIFRRSDDGFLQEYFVYFKKNQRSCGGKDPQKREGDRVDARLSLTLALLVLGVFADDHDFTLALDDLALFAHGLHGRSDFHLLYLLLASPGDAAAGQIVRRHLHRYLVAGKDPDKVHPELTGNMCQDDVAVADIHLEHRVGQGLNDRALEFNYIVFCQRLYPPKSSRQISSAIVRISGSPSVIRMVFS